MANRVRDFLWVLFYGALGTAAWVGFCYWIGHAVTDETPAGMAAPLDEHDISHTMIFWISFVLAGWVGPAMWLYMLWSVLFIKTPYEATGGPS